MCFWTFWAKKTAEWNQYLNFTFIHFWVCGCEEYITSFLLVYGLLGVFDGLDIVFIPLKHYFLWRKICKKVMLCLKWTKEGIISTLMHFFPNRYMISLAMLWCVMVYAKVFFAKVTGLAVLCQNCAVAADLACPLDNLVVVHLLSRCPPLHVLEIIIHKGSWMYVLAINWYMMLAWLSIYLRATSQVKIEEIRMPQNTCALGTACFWMRQIHVWEICFGGSLGHGTFGFLYYIVCWWMLKWFVRIFHQCLDHPHREHLVWHCFLLEMLLVDDVWVARNDA